MAKQNPIPQNPIGESFVWRDWFQRLSDRVFGSAAAIDVPIQPEYGGTGITTYNKGDIIYSNATDNLTRLPAPASTSILQMTALGVPSWTTAGLGTVTSVGGTGTVNGLTLTGTVTSSGNLTLGGTLDLSSPPAIGSTTPAAGTFTTLTATGESLLGLNGSKNQTFRATAGTGAFPWVQTSHASGDARIRAAASSGAVPLSVSSLGSQAVRFYTNAFTDLQFQISNTASAVNYVQVTGGATNAGPIISVQGSDANAELQFRTKGLYNHVFQNGSGNANFIIDQTAGTSVVNRLQASGALTNFSPRLSAVGSDTNIDLTLTPKGTGNVRFGTLTASADAAITGYITIKDSGGTVRKLAVIA